MQYPRPDGTGDAVVLRAGQQVDFSSHVVSKVSVASSQAGDWASGVLRVKDTPLTSRLLTPVLVDARTGNLTAVVKVSWYLIPPGDMRVRGVCGGEQ